MNLKHELIAEITRIKWCKYQREDLEMLNEFHLQQILSDLIIGGENGEYKSFSEWTHLRNISSVGECLR